jgi:AcrR family transcriptional regulator
MTNTTDKKRDDLRKRLIDAAEGAIAEGGLRSLKARDVTAKAGCALGGLYNAVEDLDQLVILVNSRTLGRLGQDLQRAVPPDASPTEAMQALAGTYVDFALDNTALWSAVFNHRLPKGAEVPDWHKAEYPVLIAEIIGHLSQLRPDLPPEALKLRAQTLFASVHGVVQLAIHGRFVGGPLSVLKSEVSALVDAMTVNFHAEVSQVSR